ncbi:hypothetical protein BDQ94DRAFT_137833 [Aspergillus welwitschiae]|uniref:Uncharacterized protein n=1 Tax=Aspergillus welwitschiae TaxID=1341132 RepID=A0A3F3QBG8_9EURO|nr:hypothetical protein BDQ94DRAFT_137833 [Aspergillus welwitschiae]RDH36447.1 hypothetical protein BDQ94DRAFT_137833 [Aspergillus welwitschiae]
MSETLAERRAKELAMQKANKDLLQNLASPIFKLSLYYPIWRARAVSSQMASTSSAPAVAHPEPTIVAESQTSQPDVRTWPPSPPLVLQSSAPGRGFIA